MSELVAISLIWVLVGAVYMYYLSIREYDAGFMDAVQLHAEGRLTYTLEDIGDDKAVLMIEIDDGVE